MTKRKHFRVERHPPTEWRIVNAHIGHGLIFPSRQQAIASANKLNIEFDRWVKDGMETNPLPRRRITRNQNSY